MMFVYMVIVYFYADEWLDEVLHKRQNKNRKRD